jgi:hypothetical protein
VNRSFNHAILTVTQTAEHLIECCVRSTTKIRRYAVCLSVCLSVWCIAPAPLKTQVPDESSSGSSRMATTPKRYVLADRVATERKSTCVETRGLTCVQHHLEDGHAGEHGVRSEVVRWNDIHVGPRTETAAAMSSDPQPT